MGAYLVGSLLLFLGHAAGLIGLRGLLASVALLLGGNGLLGTLLAMRSQLHRLVRHLSEAEVLAIGRFALIAVVILPLLPDQPFGPWGVWNPRQLWLVVVMVSGFSFAGYLAARHGVLPQPAIPGLNAFVLYFALPCMLYRFGSTTPIAQLLDAWVAGLYLLCGLVVVAVTIAFTLNARTRWNDAALGALVAAFPNSGFMGVPLIVALLGASAAGTVILTMVVDMVITSSLCIALSRLDDAQGNGRSAVFDAGRKALRGVLTNPMPWAIILGGVASAWAFTLPKPLEQTVWLLADAASPVALFTIGAVLARAQMTANRPMPLADYVPVAVMKLFVHPLLVLAVGSLAIRAGAPLAPSALTVMVLAAALPSASNVSLLAERFGADNGRIARIILVTTAVAFLTFSGAVTLLT